MSLMLEFEERHNRIRECIEDWGKSVDNPNRQKELLAEIGKLQKEDLEAFDSLNKELSTLETRLEELIRERNK